MFQNFTKPQLISFWAPLGVAGFIDERATAARMSRSAWVAWAVKRMCFSGEVPLEEEINPPPPEPEPKPPPRPRGRPRMSETARERRRLERALEGASRRLEELKAGGVAGEWDVAAASGEVLRIRMALAGCQEPEKGA